MFKHVLEVVKPQVSGSNALDIISHIHDLDRWSSFDKYRQSSRYCFKKMKQYGLEAELFPIPADGEAMHGDWIMPRAWDAKEATLTVLKPDGSADFTLCRYTQAPCSLVMYSKATSPGGVTAEIVVLEGGSKAEDYEGVQVHGKVILTDQSPRDVKLEAVKHGAVGIISDHLSWGACRPPLELPETLAWVSFDSDYRHGGWGIKKGDTQCWGFMLTPRQGYELRKLIKQQGSVSVHAEIDSRLYGGKLEVATGWIPGRSREEVLMNGHLHEVGAIDNASGAGVAIEVLRALNELIDAGKLKRPKRGIRMLFTYECMGTMAAVVRRRDLFARNIVAALTMDCVGGRESLTKAPLSVWQNPHAQTSYTDTLLKRIMTHLAAEEELLVSTKYVDYGGADNIIADPTINIPCPALIECPYTDYHTSTDTPDKLDPDKLAWIGTAAATYVYFIANAGANEARWLAAELAGEAHAAVVRETNEYVARHYAAGAPEADKGTLGDLWRSLAYLQYRYDIGLDAVPRLAKRQAKPLREAVKPLKHQLAAAVEQGFERAAKATGSVPRKPRKVRKRQASGVVPKRVVIGPSCNSRIPRDEQEAWEEMCKRNNVAASSALFWADGQRTVAEIEELVEGESGRRDVRLMEFFEAMEKYGYVKLLHG